MMFKWFHGWIPFCGSPFQGQWTIDYNFTNAHSCMDWNRMSCAHTYISLHDTLPSRRVLAAASLDRSGPTFSVCVYIYTHIPRRSLQRVIALGLYMCVYIYIYIYIQIASVSRQPAPCVAWVSRKRNIYIYIYIHIHTYTYTP